MQKDTIILKALAEIRRGQILSTKANPQTADLYTDAYAHAIMHSVCPIFEEEIGFAESTDEKLNLFPFYETYDVPHNLVQEIAELINPKWLNKEQVTFYNIEEQYDVGGKQWPGKVLRVDLINICRYFYLRNMFDEEFWKQFMSDCPSEASSVTDLWSREEIVLWVHHQ